MTAQVSSFPWTNLPRLSRAAVQQGMRARRAVERAVDLAALERELGRLATADVRLETHGVSVADFGAVGSFPAARVGLHLADETAEVLIALDPALATDVLRRVLARPLGFEAPQGNWSPALQGALEAVVLELARRSTGQRAVAVVALPVPCEEGPAILVRATVTLAGRPYAASAMVRVLRPPPPPPTVLRGSFPIELPVVIGWCGALPRELAELTIGDAWSCGSGWKIDVRGVGEGVLVSPMGETGVLVGLAEDGTIVVRGETRHVPIEEANGAMDEATEVTDAVTDAVGQTPVLVRVELGHVSLLAREWAELRPGDVIRTEQRVGAPVRLRIAGREVARGELVDVEGELGVKITSLSGEGDA